MSGSSDPQEARTLASEPHKSRRLSVKTMTFAFVILCLPVAAIIYCLMPQGSERIADADAGRIVANQPGYHEDYRPELNEEIPYYLPDLESLILQMENGSDSSELRTTSSEPMHFDSFEDYIKYNAPGFSGTYEIQDFSFPMPPQEQRFSNAPLENYSRHWSGAGEEPLILGVPGAYIEKWLDDNDKSTSPELQRYLQGNAESRAYQSGQQGIPNMYLFESAPGAMSSDITQELQAIIRQMGAVPQPTTGPATAGI